MGSTRWGSHIKRTTVEDSLTLALGQMARAGHLVAGNSGRVSWSRGEKEIASIRYRVRPEDGGLVLVLQYTCTTRGAAGRDVAVPVSLETQPMRFGGVRWWGRCPLAVGGRPCQRRVCKLYLPPESSLFGCRVCHGLTYASAQQHDKRASALRRNPEALAALLSNLRGASLSDLALALKALPLGRG